MYKQSTRVDTRPRGVAVNMSPCHGEDRQFKSDRGRHFFLQKIMPRQLSWQSNGLKIRVSTVRFCPEAPFICGNSSAVEHRLAKAGVASSNLVSRSNFIWRHSQAVRQRSAKPLFPSSILGAASTIVTHAGVAEQADATDLKSVGWKQPYRFDSGPRHQLRLTLGQSFFLYTIKTICENYYYKLRINI